MENIPCKWSVVESQSHPYGMGSATETWTECSNPKLDDPCTEEEEDLWDCNNGEKCPGYEALKVLVCEKHGEYLEGDTCGGCGYEQWKHDKELAEQYWKEMEERDHGSKEA